MVTENELTEAYATLEPLEMNSDGTFLLRRIVKPKAQLDWFKSAWNIQKRRHRAANSSELLWKLVLIGHKPADPDDDWGTALDTIFNEIGNNPSLAFAPEPDFDRCTEKE